MAGVKGAVSSGSLTSMASFSDAIPREYHRKILKKIAQLTKVIHNLNTKLDESESQFQCLKAQHQKELQLIEEEKSVKTKLWEEERTLVAILQTQVASLETQKEKLGHEKEAYIGAMENRLQQQQSQLEEVEKTLSATKSELSHQETELRNLEALSSNLRHELKDTKEKAGEEIEALNQKCSFVIEANEKAVKQLTNDHERAMKDLASNKEKELLELRESLTKQRDGQLQNEMEAYKLSFEKLRSEFAEKESQLNEQLSFLSSDLSTVKDNLAVAEQRNRDLERDLDMKAKSSRTIDDLLKEKEEELTKVISELGVFKEKSSLALGKCEQQSEEMKSMAVRIGELEAVRVSQEHDLSDLCNKLKAMSENCELLEIEKMTSVQNAKETADGASQKIKKLEKQLESVAQEKRELRAQFAREIEASRSQLTQRETDLEGIHLKELEEMRAKHIKELDSMIKENEQRLIELRKQLESQNSSELSNRDQKYSNRIAELTETLSGKIAEIRSLRSSQQSLLESVTEKEKLLGSSKSRVDQLTRDLSFCGDSLCSVRGERDAFKEKIIQLELSIDDLNHKLAAAANRHKEEVSATETRVREEMETYWSSKLKDELSLLRNELQRQNEEISQASLKKMVDIKDTALKGAQEVWSKEKETLLQKIVVLEKDLHDLQLSLKTALDEAEATAAAQVSQLKKELESARGSAMTAIEGLMTKHKEEIERLKEQHEIDKKLQADAMSELNRKEIDELTRAHNLSIIALKTKLNKEKEWALSDLAQSCREKRTLFEQNCISEHQEALVKLESAYAIQLEEQKEEASVALKKATKEFESSQASLKTLSKDCEGTKSLLAREKERGERLMIDLKELKAQLEVKKQELIATKREMESLMKLKEESLTSSHKAEIESMHSHYRHQSQTLLSDFKKAKQILTAKLEEKERRHAASNVWLHLYVHL
uniref:Protein FAM184A/B N-terminal domain-containing protein n=1 Tax=Amphimedon queenslandica TaxID=400682 RepID=A0A1X7VPZ6_AMPQE